MTPQMRDKPGSCSPQETDGGGQCTTRRQNKAPCASESPLQSLRHPLLQHPEQPHSPSSGHPDPAAVGQDEAVRSIPEELLLAEQSSGLRAGKRCQPPPAPHLSETAEPPLLPLCPSPVPQDLGFSSAFINTNRNHTLEDTQLGLCPISLIYLTFLKDLQNLIVLFAQSHADVVLRDSLPAQTEPLQHPALQNVGEEFCFQSWPSIQARWQHLTKMQSNIRKDYILGICLYFCLLMLFKLKKPFEILIRFSVNHC